MDDLENIDRHLEAEGIDISDIDIEIPATDGGMPEEQSSFLDSVEDNWTSYDNYKLAVIGLGAGSAVYAAVDPSAAPIALAMDEIVHYGLGVSGSLSGEMGYRLLGGEEKYGTLPKYGIMISAGTSLGGLGQLSQEVISGAPEMESVYKAALAAAGTTAAQSVVDNSVRKLE